VLQCGGLQTPPFTHADKHYGFPVHKKNNKILAGFDNLCKLVNMPEKFAG
jgi:hypothetical protein